jgi:hypothetical protein
MHFSERCMGQFDGADHVETRAAISLTNAAATAGQRNAGFENRPPFVWYIVLAN